MSTVKKEDQGFEHEAKSMLSEEDFKKLKDFFKIEPGSIEQHVSKILVDENHKMIQSMPVGTMFRVCVDRIMELKVHGTDGSLMHIRQKLQRKELDALLDDGVLPAGNIQHFFSLKRIEEPFTFLGTIDRLRSYTLDKGIALDQATYTGGHMDYEIKIAGEEYVKNHHLLERLLEQHDIPFVPSRLKIQRFYKAIGIVV
ncbi:MAG: CYTH domain-containing protein [Patescibacteria group bacterium]